MKILMVNDYDETIGGAEIYMQNLKKKLIQLGHVVETFSSTVSKEQYVYRLRHITFIDLIKRIFNIQTLLAFKRKYNTFQPDIIHIHSYFNELSPSFLLACGSTPCIMTIHDERIIAAVTNQELRNGKRCKLPVCPGCLNCVGFWGTIYQRIKNIIHYLLLKRINLFIVPSKFLEKEIKKYSSLRPVHQTYNGFDLIPYKEVNNNKIILYIGRLTEDKGVDYLIQAMPAVTKKYSEARLHIVGEGDEEKKLKKMTKNLNMEQYVLFHEAVPHQEVKKHMYSADIVCIPSICNDNLPTICIEAMSTGRAVIASNIGGLPEMVEDGKTGLLFPAKETDAIAEKILYLFDNPKKVQLLGKEASKFIQRFNTDTHIKHIITIYNSLIT